MEGPVETSNGSSNSVPNNGDSTLEPVKGFYRPDWRSQLSPPNSLTRASNSASESALSASRLDGKRLTRIRFPELKDFAGPIGGPNSALQIL